MSNFSFLGSRGWHFLLLACILALLISGKTYADDENEENPSESATAKRRPSHPHCGLYCLYTVMKLAGQESNFQELIKPEYIGSRKGG